jgi:hypothetical protein
VAGCLVLTYVRGGRVKLHVITSLLMLTHTTECGKNLACSVYFKRKLLLPFPLLVQHGVHLRIRQVRRMLLRELLYARQRKPGIGEVFGAAKRMFTLEKSDII